MRCVWCVNNRHVSDLWLTLFTTPADYAAFQRFPRHPTGSAVQPGKAPSLDLADPRPPLQDWCVDLQWTQPEGPVHQGPDW